MERRKDKHLRQTVPAGRVLQASVTVASVLLLSLGALYYYNHYGFWNEQHGRGRAEQAAKLDSVQGRKSHWRPKNVLSRIRIGGQPKQMTFEKKVEQVCQNGCVQVCAKPKLPMPVFDGLPSFFDYLLSPPDVGFCYSWLRFGGEMNIGHLKSQTGASCADEVRDAKYICMNKEYRMTEGPCLVYAISVPEEDQFERDMQLFSCQVHSIVDSDVSLARVAGAVGDVTNACGYTVPTFQGFIYEHIKRSKFWYQHEFKLSMQHKDVTKIEKTYSDSTVFGRFLDYKTYRYRTLRDIVSSLGHLGREIKYAKSDVIGTEMTLLKQIIQYQDEIDIKQIGVSLFLSRPDYLHSYEQLYKIFQGLACSGYRLVKVRPLTQFMQSLYVKETNTTYYPAYNVNFVKDLAL